MSRARSEQGRRGSDHAHGPSTLAPSRVRPRGPRPPVRTRSSTAASSAPTMSRCPPGTTTYRAARAPAPSRQPTRRYCCWPFRHPSPFRNRTTALQARSNHLRRSSCNVRPSTCPSSSTGQSNPPSHRRHHHVRQKTSHRKWQAPPPAPPQQVRATVSSEPPFSPVDLTLGRADDQEGDDITPPRIFVSVEPTGARRARRDPYGEAITRPRRHQPAGAVGVRH